MQKQFFISAFSFLLLITGCTAKKIHYPLDGDEPTAENRDVAGAGPEQRIGNSQGLLRVVRIYRARRVRKGQKRKVAAYNRKVRRIKHFSFPKNVKKKWGECILCCEGKLTFQYCLAGNDTCSIWICEECCTRESSNYRELHLIDYGQESPYTVTALEARCPYCRHHLPGAKLVREGSHKFYTNGEIETILRRRGALQGPLN